MVAATMPDFFADITAPYTTIEAWTYDRFIAPAVAELLERNLGEILDRIPQGAQVLDVGCGGGHALELLAARRPDLRLHGIDPQHLDMVLQTMFSHPGLQEYATRMRERRFDDVGFDLLGGLKDVQLILDASAEARVPLPFANIVRDKSLTAAAHGLSAKDVSVVYEITRMSAGLK